MSSTDKSREEVKAAREAKKLAKQKKKDPDQKGQEAKVAKDLAVTEKNVKVSPVKGKDEVDKAVIHTEKPIVKENKEIKAKVDIVPKPVEKTVKIESDATSADDKSKDQIKAERAAKKVAKQAKKKGSEGDGPKGDGEMTVKDVVNTLKDIAIVAKEVQDVTAKVQAIHLDGSKPEESGKSKAELKAERRAKQEAQRAAKQAATAAKPAAKPDKPKEAPTEALDKEKSPKPKSLDRAKSKPQVAQRVSWFQHLSVDSDKQPKIAINSNLHPAIIKLGVQLSSRVVSGSNARCIALVDALKKMVSDYTLPARTEYARGLETHLKESLTYLWGMRQPTASQVNAVKFFRHHLTQLPHNVDEFDAKKILHEEIDRYIREQIDMAGEAISIAVRNKISHGDKILTYGCSSLIERIFREAWAAGVKFEVVVVGNRIQPHGREMLRRLVKYGVPCTYLDITAASYIMQKISKVLFGAQALLADGSVRGALGTAQLALLARARNVPVLVAAETHKVSARVQAAPADYNELGDPDDLIDKSDPDSPLKDWRNNPNLTPLNLMYDVTPPSLVTAVVTELAILPCTSAPVVLRFKLSEYGIVAE
ncbi:translation initiation factor eIF-2B subunit delta [Leguminivora glycinivorella]|uniref:translation initiation factor eIF-2B subunit delta n=1 Tax=Leguminivora glycinivorella TaxID=1035111 RepID=UPI00200F6E0C|nr:translation initiation factor eIF-2B subunit delta [Leguminivora glycinivorella]XP_047985326.1 translation initiation factor eIF-2B subunit delta [Leguminivora glycinivorella]